MAITSFKSALTANDSTAQEILGAIRYEDNKIYKYVKFSGTTALVAGQFVCYVLSDETCTTVDSANSALGAGGALFSNSTTGTAYYGWIQIGGVFTMNSALTAGAAGNKLTPIGSSAGKLDVAAAVTDQHAAVCVSVAVAAAPVILLTCPN